MHPRAMMIGMGSLLLAQGCGDRIADRRIVINQYMQSGDSEGEVVDPYVDASRIPKEWIEDDRRYADSHELRVRGGHRFKVILIPDDRPPSGPTR